MKSLVEGTPSPLETTLFTDRFNIYGNAFISRRGVCQNSTSCSNLSP